MYSIRQHGDGSAKGLGAFSSQDVKQGQTVLCEHPLLVYPQASMVGCVCSYCLKDLGNEGLLPHEVDHGPSRRFDCPSCGSARFCNEACRAAAEEDPGSHSPIVCAIMQSAYVENASDETVSAMHFLSRVYGLFIAGRKGDQGAQARYENFLSLSDGNSDTIMADEEYKTWIYEVTNRFSPCLKRLEEVSLLSSELPEASRDFIESICLKDLVNAYGIRAPLRLGSDVGMLRGTALYKEASRINHECLPNVARCEDFDEDQMMRFVALHDLPIGEEITQSYFPLNWEVEDRQTRCSTVYGFRCTCPRCTLEGGMDGGPNAAENLHGAPDRIDDGYISIFLLKYLCVNEECEGTMVPLLDCPNRTQVCNVCSVTRTEAEFLHSIASERYNSNI
jgi:hypothetical protein